jgi:uncharacterized protein (DUF58 family)
MLPAHIAAQIKRMEIITRKLFNGVMGGVARSALKGSGFDFDQIRDYQMGDDVRFIDWGASLRTDKLLVKEYRQERNRTIFLLVDSSASVLYGSDTKARQDVIAHIASALALAANWGKDTVSLLIFSDEIELFIPPAQGLLHVRLIMEKLFSMTPARKKTDIGKALKKMLAYKKRGATVFLVSDCIEQYDAVTKKIVPLAAKHHDLVVIRCLDPREHTFPSVGFLAIKDPETGTEYTVDTRDMNRLVGERLADQTRFFQQHGIPYLDITINQEFLPALIHFFRRRMMY